MIFDNKGRLFGKISIVDILIVVIIVAAAAGVYYKFGRSKTNTLFTKTDKVQISFYVESISEYAIKCIKVGDPIVDRLQNTPLGKITAIQVGPDITFNPDSSGHVVSSSKPGYVSVTITAEGQSIYSSSGITVNGVDYYVYKQFELRTGISDLWVRVSGIKKAKG